MSPYVGPFRHPDLARPVHVHETTVDPQDEGLCDNPGCGTMLDAWDDAYTDPEGTCLCCRPACVLAVHVARREEPWQAPAT